MIKKNRYFKFLHKVFIYLSINILSPSNIPSSDILEYTYASQRVQVWWKPWLRNDYGFVFGQKLRHKHRCVSACVIMVQNLWLDFTQFRTFLANCFAQSAHNFMIVLTVRPCDKNSWLTTTLQPKKTVRKTLTFDETWCDFFGFGSSGHCHWDDWALVSMPLICHY